MKLGPGLTFSWKRALGITAAKRKISRKTAIPPNLHGHRSKLRKILGMKRKKAAFVFVFIHALGLDGCTGSVHWGVCAMQRAVLSCTVVRLMEEYRPGTGNGNDCNFQ